jgi:hypothetical protein
MLLKKDDDMDFAQLPENPEKLEIADLFESVTDPDDHTLLGTLMCPYEGVQYRIHHLDSGEFVGVHKGSVVVWAASNVDALLRNLAYRILTRMHVRDEKRAAILAKASISEDTADFTAPQLFIVDFHSQLTSPVDGEKYDIFRYDYENGGFLITSTRFRHNVKSVPEAHLLIADHIIHKAHVARLNFETFKDILNRAQHAAPDTNA